MFIGATTLRRNTPADVFTWTTRSRGLKSPAGAGTHDVSTLGTARRRLSPTSGCRPSTGSHPSRRDRRTSRAAPAAAGDSGSSRAPPGRRGWLPFQSATAGQAPSRHRRWRRGPAGGGGGVQPDAGGHPGGGGAQGWPGRRPPPSHPGPDGEQVDEREDQPAADEQADELEHDPEDLGAAGRLEGPIRPGHHVDDRPDREGHPCQPDEREAREEDRCHEMHRPSLRFAGSGGGPPGRPTGATGGRPSPAAGRAARALRWRK